MEKVVLLSVEFAAVFILVPLLLYYRVIPNAPIPFLLLLALVAWFEDRISTKQPAQRS